MTSVDEKPKRKRGSGAVPRRPWTDEELDFVRATMLDPQQDVADILGRSKLSISNCRQKLRDSGDTVALANSSAGKPWTSDEDAIISTHYGWSAKALQKLLSARTEEAIATRRRKLGVRYSVPLSGRPLIAKTCTKCGRLRAANMFHFRKKLNSWSSHCRDCERAATRVNSRAPHHVARSIAYADDAQSESLETATRKGEPWTEADYRVLLDQSLSRKEVARRLGRTYASVARQKVLIGATRQVEPEDGIWKVEV